MKNVSGPITVNIRKAPDDSAITISTFSIENFPAKGLGLTNRVVDTIDLGDGNYPSDIAFDPTNGDMYVTSGFVVFVIDTSTNRVIDTIPVGNGSMYGIAFNPINRNMYVAIHNNVSLIDTSMNKVIDTIPVGNRAEGVAFNPINLLHHYNHLPKQQ